MAPYWLLLGFAGVAGFFLCELKKSRNRDLFFLFLLTVVMIAMATLRATSVGVDTQVYMDYFSLLPDKGFDFLFSPSNSYRDEPGYSLLNLLISRMTQNPFAFSGLVSGLIIALRTLFIYRYSTSPWISVFVYIGFGFFGYALCTLRQELAISIFMFAIPALQKRRIVPYMLIVILASTFHSSGWILLPVYFLGNLPLNKIMLGIYGGSTLGVLMFSEPLLAFITKYVYKTYQPGTYYTQGRDYSTAVFPVAMFILAFLMMKKLLQRRPENQVLINFSYYAALFFILTLKHFIFQRVALLFLPAVLLLIPEILASIAPGEGEKGQELNRLLSLDKVRQRQSREKIAALKEELKNETALYYTAMGLLLAGCCIYFLFLLSANRLLLVPYHTFFYV